MKKDVEAFKRELGNYNYYRLNLEGTLELIRINEDNLSNLHGIDPSKQHVPSVVPWVESDEFKRISDELDKLNARKELRIRQISYIESVLDQLTDETREACIQIYAERRSYLELSRKYGYSKAGLYYKIKKELEEAINFEPVQ